MIVDGRELIGTRTIAADVCIVGAGAAGITIAREFANKSFSVALLEAGGFEARSESQTFNEGESVGHQYPQLDVCRRRVFGGSTDLWGGWCRALDDSDFAKRDWIKFSGWPISSADLESDYQKARRVCLLPDPSPEFSAGNVSSTHESFAATPFEISPIRFGAAFRRQLARAANITLITDANVVAVNLNESRTAVQCVTVRSIYGADYAVQARCFVLAAGGIENARLLLASQGSSSFAVGNEHDLVGRFFSDHLHFYDSASPLTSANIIKTFRLERRGALSIRGCLSLTDEVRREQRLMGFAVTGHNPEDPHDVVAPATGQEGYRSLRLITHSIVRGRITDNLPRHIHNVAADLNGAFALAIRKLWKPAWRTVRLGFRAEQTPNPDSRVTLSDKRDALGFQRAKLEWRPTDEDFESARRAYDLFGQYLTKREPAVLRHAVSTSNHLTFGAASHHMGTTRMHEDPRYGVVDRDCLVHGIGNLWIAGSSVFPTAGWAPPTLTIIALALRLARRVSECLSQ
jgi:choline dehydrogenase-like flavoprotein